MTQGCCATSSAVLRCLCNHSVCTWWAGKEISRGRRLQKIHTATLNRSIADSTAAECERRAARSSPDLDNIVGVAGLAGGARVLRRQRAQHLRRRRRLRAGRPTPEGLHDGCGACVTRMVAPRSVWAGSVAGTLWMTATYRFLPACRALPLSHLRLRAGRRHSGSACITRSALGERDMRSDFLQLQSISATWGLWPGLLMINCR